MRTGATRTALLLTLALAGTGAVLCWVLLRPAPPLNVILISIDTLRPDRMGVYGHRPMGRSTTPFLDELAARGAVFEKACSTSSWTLPAHYAMMTGLPDAGHGMVNDRVPPPDLPGLAGILRDAGYETAGFYSGAYLHPHFGFGRGFDIYESCLPPEGRRGADTGAAGRDTGAAGRDTGAAGRGAGAAGRGGAPRTKFAAHEAVTSARVTERASAFLGDRNRRAEGRPFFLFLHYFDVHNDYLPPPPFDRGFGPPYEGWVNGRGVTSDPRYNSAMAPEDLRRLLALYDGEIAWVDDNLRRLFRRIAALDEETAENTLVIVTSDHGEEFFEHGRAGHRKNLFSCSIDIPLIVVCPGRIAAGRRVDSPARLYDILPTVTALCGIDEPEGILGRSLLPALTGEEDEPRPALLDLTRIPKEERLERITGVEHKGFKLVTLESRPWSDNDSFSAGGGWTGQEHALYDLERDPAEKHDLFEERHDRAELLIGLRDRLLDEALRAQLEGRQGEERPGTVPDHIRKSLDELGYGAGAR